MAILKVQRIIITCPSFASEIYSVIGNVVGKAQNVKKSRIYEQFLNIQIQLTPKQSVELQVWQYSPLKIIKTCTLSESLCEFDGLRQVYNDDQWQIYVDCKKVKSSKQCHFRKNLSQNKSPSKKKTKPSQITLKRNLQKQINLLTGNKANKSVRNSLNWKKGMNYYSFSSKSLKNDSTRSANGTYSGYANTQASIEYGLQESVGKNHRALITERS